EYDKGRCGRKFELGRAIGGDGLRFVGRVHQEYKIASTAYRVECYRKVDRARRRLLQIGELGILRETDHPANHVLGQYSASAWIGRCSRRASQVLAYRTLVREQVARRRLIQDANAAVAFRVVKLAALEDRGLHRAEVTGT